MGRSLAPGAPVPDLRLVVLGGGEVSLREAGRVLLAFFKISCPVCQFTLPYLNRVQPAGKVFGVSQNDAADTREFAGHFKLAFPMLLDPEYDFPASHAFGITHVPSLFLCGAGGRIEQVIEGWSKRDMEAMGAVASGENVPAWKAG